MRAVLGSIFISRFGSTRYCTPQNADLTNDARRSREELQRCVSERHDLSLRLASTQQQLDDCRRATASAEAAANDAATERQRQATAHNEEVGAAMTCVVWRCIIGGMCCERCGVMVVIMLLLLLSVVASTCVRWTR